MGMYIYVTELDRKMKRKVSDKELDETFQEALKYDPSLMIEEVLKRIKKRWFKGAPTAEYVYNIYHETPAHDGSAYQARYQFSGSGEKRIVMAYLHGIINGCSKLKIN